MNLANQSSWPAGDLPSSGALRPRLCFVSYQQIREFALPVVAEFAHRAEIEVVDGSFEQALELARQRVTQGSVDAFVSAGSNATLLRQNLTAPVATIQLGGFDILQALIRARQHADCVGIITYGQPIPELESVRALLNVDIRQYAYSTPAVARDCIAALRADGVRVVVGSSLVVELAQNAGLMGLLAYSLSSIRRGFEDALELARAARLEAGRFEQLDSVLRTLHSAVLAVDRKGQVIAANPAMQVLLEQPQLVGRMLHVIAPELSLTATMQSVRETHDAVLHLRGRDWLASQSPIVERGQVTGATLTLHDARRIEAADSALRMQKRSQQRPQRRGFASLMGQAPAFVRACEAAKRFAHSGLGVLVCGESGTGKELFAQAIHAEGARSARPFIGVNCAAFPETLLESELFGYEEGAFTGARRGGRRGLFEAAHTGTLFLDEIGDMPLALQSRLLRVLQEREVTRLGGTVAVPVDVCVIAATHRDLRAMVAAGSFRQDLFYRINVLRLSLPPLRERMEDIIPLTHALVLEQLDRLGSTRDPSDVLASLSARLQAHAWPGNLRELQNVASRIAVHLMGFAPDQDLDFLALEIEPLELFAMPSSGLVPRESRAEQARRALHAAQGRRDKAAEQLGVSRSTLWRWLRGDTHQTLNPANSCTVG